jgi:Tfp pilus assembly protein PilF
MYSNGFSRLYQKVYKPVATLLGAGLVFGLTAFATPNYNYASVNNDRPVVTRHHHRRTGNLWERVDSSDVKTEKELIDKYEQAANPNDTSSLTDLGCAYICADMSEKAVRKFEPVVKADPDNTEARIYLGHAYAKINANDKAMKEFEKVMEIGPKSAKELAYVNAAIGYLYQRDGEYTKAKEKFEEALQIDSRMGWPFEPHYGLAAIFSHENEISNAIKNLKDAIEDDPEYIPSYLLLGHLYKKSGRSHEATESFKEGIKIAQGARDEERHFYLGIYYYLENSDYRNGIKELEDATKIARRPSLRFDIYVTLADAYNRNGQPESGLENAKKAIELGPRSAIGYTVLGDAYANMHQYDDAKITFNKALQLDPNLESARRGLNAVDRSLDIIDKKQENEGSIAAAACMTIVVLGFAYVIGRFLSKAETLRR